MNKTEVELLNEMIVNYESQINLYKDYIEKLEKRNAEFMESIDKINKSYTEYINHSGQLSIAERKLILQTILEKIPYDILLNKQEVIEILDDISMYCQTEMIKLLEMPLAEKEK